MSCCDYKCDQGRSCPVRAAKVATAKPLTRICDIGGTCPQTEPCKAECLLSADYGEPISRLEEVVMYIVITLAVGLLLVLAGGAVGFLWGLT